MENYSQTILKEEEICVTFLSMHTSIITIMMMMMMIIIILQWEGYYLNYLLTSAQRL